ncbi:FkbM family methyltransferase [Clostridium minihomine]|uniref:FkbM family methyltransferase n=1 Tax=Clostridium minihomine TaxID=2045012 RepID=UPI000C77F39E|nr:FkbM family methyltransferase [Clostridium minihomine]
MPITPEVPEIQNTEDMELSVFRIPNQIDAEFDRLMQFIKERDLSQITEAIKQNLRYFSETNPRSYQSSIHFYNEYGGLWGTYFPEREDFQLAENRAYAFAEHREDFEWIYHRLEDYRSKRILVNILYYWLMSDPKRIEAICDKTFSQYFDLDLVQCDENEVFVDIGGFIGDTLVDYSKVFGTNCCKRMYCYEIVPENIKYIEKNKELFHLDSVVIRQKGAGNKNGTMYFSSNSISSVNQLSETGEYEVPVVRIDDDIEEDVTFIKMDIEGGEEKALLGCAEKIRKNHPKLALSVYHNHKDLWKLPRLIEEIDPSYRFYFRYYGFPLVPTEYVLYAI